MKKLSYFLTIFIFSTFIPNKIVSQNTEEIWSFNYRPYSEQSRFIDMSVGEDGNIFVVGCVPSNPKSYLTGFYGIFYNKNGKPDGSIGSSGKGILNFETDLDFSQYSAIDSDGNIILGRTYKYSSDIVIARFELSVNQAGEEYFKQDFYNKIEIRITGLKVNRDNDIIVTGKYKDASGNNINVIGKYNSTGTLDTTFGNNGIVEVNVDDVERLDALTIDKNNNIIVAALLAEGNPKMVGYCLVKYNNAGEPDTTFGENGVSYGESWRGRIIRIAENINGDIVSLGYNYYYDSKSDFNPSTFIDIVDSNGNRKFYKQFLTSEDNRPSSLSLNNKGEIAFSLYTNAANTTFNTGDGYSKNYLYRLTTNGETVDSIVLPFFTYGNMIKKLIYNDDGSVLLGGTTDFKGGEVITLLRILKNGEFDEQFGKNGILYSSLSKLYIKPALQDVSVDNENNIFILSNRKILKLNSEGKRDSTFNYDGLLANRLSIKSIEANNSGGVICGGPLRTWTEYDYSVLLNLKNNSYLDRNFGDWSGVSIINYYRYAHTHHICDIAINNNGDIITLLGGEKEYPVVTKILPDGRVSGKVFQSDHSFLEKVHSVAMDSEGKILFCGKKFDTNSNNGRIIVHRKNSDVSTDRTFNSKGYSTYSSNEGYTVATDLQNRVLVSTVYKSHISIIRFNYNGTIDKAFGNDGILQTPFIQENASKKNFVIDKSGHIIVIGKIQNDSINEMALIRYNGDGTVDSTFGDSGIITNNLEVDNAGMFIGLDNDENIIAVGTSENEIIIKKYKNQQVVSVRNNDIGVPEKYSLSQNYPNPFNPTTTITYSIPTLPASSPLAKGRTEVGFVILKVYDILGREVATLVNKHQSPGTYTVKFNASKLNSGIYFYKLQAGNFTQVKRMMLIK